MGTIIDRIWGTIGFVTSQITGTIGNWWGTISAFDFNDVLPPSIYSTLTWLLRKIPEALGLGTPTEQIYGSIVLAIALVLSIIGSVYAVILIIPFSIGVLRQVPIINSVWVRIVPRWDGISLR